eukprot:COSAG06_NODE_21963_length_739_cov_0.957812_1_plen_41_part_10
MLAGNIDRRRPEAARGTGREWQRRWWVFTGISIACIVSERW